MQSERLLLDTQRVRELLRTRGQSQRFLYRSLGLEEQAGYRLLQNGRIPMSRAGTLLAEVSLFFGVPEEELVAPRPGQAA